MRSAFLISEVMGRSSRRASSHATIRLLRTNKPAVTLRMTRKVRSGRNHQNTRAPNDPATTVPATSAARAYLIFRLCTVMFGALFQAVPVHLAHAHSVVRQIILF